jgi:transposase
MNDYDARMLSPAAREALRLRVARAVADEGMPQIEAVEVFRVSRTSVHEWTKAYRSRGEAGLKTQRLGRPPRSRLTGHQAATAVNLITDRCPDQLKLPYALWTRQAVCELLAERFDLQVSVWTVGRYLKRWNLTPQKPLRRAYEQDPAAVKRWLDKQYPVIRQRAKRENAEIHWGDQMGLRSDHQAGTSYGLRGQTPVIQGTGQRFGCNMISTITNRGTLRFAVFKRRFTAAVMIDFCARLLRSVDQKVFLIVDRHPVHRAKKFHAWLDTHAARIELFYLPGYSPQLNPDECLNQDVKSNAVGRQRARDQTQLIDNVRRHLRSTQRRPDKVKRYFQEEHVTYAAA